MPQRLVQDEHEQQLAQRINERVEYHDPLRQALERLDASERGEPDQAPSTPAPQPAPAASRRGLFADYSLQVLGGARDAVVSTLEAVNSAAEWLNDKSALLKKLDQATSLNFSIPEVPASERMGGEFVRGVSQFLTGFIPGGKVAKFLKITTPFAKGMAAGAIADALVFDPDMPTVGNLIEDLVGDAPDDLRNSLLEYVTIRESDTQAEKRFKRVLEGAGLGAITEGVFRSAKALRTFYKSAEGATDAAARPASAAAKAAAPMLPEADDVTQLAEQFRLNVAKQRRVLGELRESLTEESGRPIQKAMDEALEMFPPEGRMKLEDVRALYPGATLNDSQAIGLIETVAESADKTRIIARAFLDGGTPWERFMDQLSTFAQIEPARLGVEAEAGRTLRVLGDPIVGKRQFIAQATQALRKAEGGQTREQVARAFAGMKSLQELVQVTRNLQKPGWWDLFVEVRVNGLLSGPRTFVVNGLGNTAALGETIFERFSASRLGTGAVAPGEAAAMMTGVVQSWGDSMRLAARSFRGELPDLIGTASKLEGRMGGERQQVFARVIREKLGDFGTWLDDVEGLINVPSRGLVAADDFFKSIAFNAELRALARRQAYQAARAEGAEGLQLAARVSELERRVLANPPSYLKEQAQEFAAYVTFTKNVTGHTAEAISKLRQTPVGQFIVPFSRTPQNIFKFGVERSIFAPVLPSVRQALRATGVERELAITRMATGSMFMSFAGVMAYNGVLTGGGPSDAGLRRTLALGGWQPYSVKIGNTWVSYNRLDPLGGLLGMAADFVEIAGELNQDQQDSLGTGMVAVVGSIYKNLGSKTFLRGIADAIDAIADPDQNLFHAAQSALASSVPFSSLLRSIGVAIDPVLYDKHGLFDDARQLIPGYSRNLPARRDLFGNKMLLPPALGQALLGPLAGVFVPFATTTDMKDPVVQRLTEMRYSSNAVRAKIGDVDLSPRQFDRYQELAGQGLRQDLARLMLSPGFDTLGADTQKAMVSGEVDRHRERARQQVIREFGDLREAGRASDQQRRQREVREPAADMEQLRQIANPPPSAPIRVAP